MKKFKEILLVDDDDAFQLINRVTIQKMDITESIIIKADGLQALTFLKEHYSTGEKLTVDACPDLILLDIDMPVMSGFAFLQALQEMGAESLIHSKIIMLSSSIADNDLRIANSFGVKGYIIKPLTKEKLFSILNEDTLS